LRWIIDRTVNAEAPLAVAWVQQYMRGYDLARLDWFRIDRGRHGHGGLYGRCWWPTGRGKARKGFRISCQVPGPWPFRLEISKPPFYMDERPAGAPWPPPPPEWPAGCVLGLERCCAQTGRRWCQVKGETVVLDLGEAVAWIAGHEAFHFLRKDRQVPGRDTEIQADAAGDALLARWRAERGTFAIPLKGAG
jgi:hypothetical protein